MLKDQIKEIFDYCTTPTDFKNLADTVAGYLGYARDSERQKDELYKRQFIAIESITCGIGWKLVLVRKNGATVDLYPGVGELEYDAFRAFLKGLVIGLAFNYTERKYLNENGELIEDENIEGDEEECQKSKE